MDAPGTKPLSATSQRLSWSRYFFRILLKALGGLLFLGITGWMAMAICYADLHGRSPRIVRAVLVVIVSISVFVFIRPRRRGVLAFIFGFAGVLCWFFSISPSNVRDWGDDVAVLPYATIEGNLVHLHNIRNFDYRSETDYTAAYYDRTFDVSHLQTLDLILSYWSGPTFAHEFLSFGFDDGQYLSISIETRKEKSEKYSAVQGFFRQYEIVYVVADERDLIRLRTNYRGEEVYLYRMRTPPEKIRAVFRDYLSSINSLQKQPRFFNALTENCATSVFSHLCCAPPYPPFTLGVLFSGYLARYEYENGELDRSFSFDELERRSHINDLAEPADQAVDFSQRIRARLR